MKLVCIGLLVLPMMPLNAGTNNDQMSAAYAELVLQTTSVNTDAHNDTQFDWSPIIDAIILVESEGNPNAVSGNSVGAMQITPILVRECNNILQARGERLRYTLDDRYSVEKSKEMFLLIQSHYNKENNVEKAIRSWNGGPTYSKKSTNGYYKKVLRRMS